MKRLFAIPMALFALAVALFAVNGCGGGSTAGSVASSNATGTIVIQSNLPNTTFTLDGIRQLKAGVADGVVYNAPVGLHNFGGCDAKDGFTLTTNQASATLTVGGSITFSCTWTATTGTITATSNLAGWVVIDNVRYYIPTNGGVITLNGQVGGNHTFSCEAQGGYTVISNMSTANLVVPGPLAFSCTFTPVSTSGVGSFSIYSNQPMESSSSITCGGQVFYGRVTAANTSITVTSNAPANTSCSTSCSAITGQTVVNPPATSVSPGGSQQVLCTYTPNGTPPPATDKLVTVKLHVDVAFANSTDVATITGPKASYPLHIGVDNYTYDLTILTPKPTEGTYSVSCPTGYSAPVASIALTEGQSFTFNCNIGDGFVPPIGRLAGAYLNLSGRGDGIITAGAILK